MTPEVVAAFIGVFVGAGLVVVGQLLQYWLSQRAAGNEPRLTGPMMGEESSGDAGRLDDWND